MAVAFGMILFGAILVYGGATNRSVWALARGDNTTAKPVVQKVEPGKIRPAGVPSP